MSSWREERRADMAAERAEARADRRAEAELRRVEEREREQRERRERAERARRRQQAAAMRAARIRRALTWVRENGDIAAVLAVMAAAAVPALASQWHSLHRIGMSSAFAALLAVMLELTTWAATAGEERALREGRPVLPYRVAVWASASVAALVNYLNGAREYGLTGAIVLAASSLGPVALWHVVMAGRKKTRRTKGQRGAERAAKRHARQRRRHHPEVTKLAERLLSSAPLGALTAEAAWRTAWELTHGVPVLGVTADLIVTQRKARAGVERALLEDPTADPDMPLDPFPYLTIPGPLGPADSVFESPFPAALEAASRPESETPGTLAGIGQEGTRGPSRKGPGKGPARPREAGTERPLDPAHLHQVRALADVIAGTGQRLSNGDIRKLLGCRNEYAMRLRLAVEAERKGDDGGEAGPVPVSA